MTRNELEMAKLLIEALERIAREHHDLDHNDRANWAMRASGALEEALAYFHDGARISAQ